MCNSLPPCPVVRLLLTCSSVPTTSSFRRLAAVGSFEAVHSNQLHRRRSVRLSSNRLESSLSAHGSTLQDVEAARFPSSSLSRWTLSGTRTIRIPVSLVIHCWLDNEHGMGPIIESGQSDRATPKTARGHHAYYFIRDHELMERAKTHATGALGRYCGKAQILNGALPRVKITLDDARARSSGSRFVLRSCAIIMRRGAVRDLAQLSWLVAYCLCLSIILYWLLYRYSLYY